VEKILVFIDGGYLDKITNQAKIRPDMSKLSMKLCDGIQFVRTYYCNFSISPGKSTWIPAFAGMTIHIKWLSPVIPAKAGIQ